MGFEVDIFKIRPLAIDINGTCSLHVAELVRNALRNMGKIVAASKSLFSAPPTGRMRGTPLTVAPKSW